MPSLTRKIALNAITQMTGKIMSTIFGLLSVALMTRYLGQTGFGGYTTIIAFLQFFGILVDMGLSLTVIQMISPEGAPVKKIMSNIFTLRFFSALIFLGLAPLIVLFFPYPPLIKLGVAITTISFFCISLHQVLVGVFQKNLRMDKVALAEVVGRIVLLASIFSAIILKTGLLGVMAAVVLGGVTNFLITYLFSLKYVKISFEFDFGLWKEIITRTWPIALSIAFNLVYLKADIIILSLYKSQAEVGIYGATYRVLEIIITFPIMFIGLILPLLTQSWAEKNLEKFKVIMQKSFDALIIITAPLVVGTLFLARPIMILIAGPQFAASGDVLKIIIFATGIIFIGSLFGHTIVAINKQRLMIWGYFATAVVGLICYLIFIPRYSYFGAAFSTVFTEALIGTICFWVVWRTTRFFPSLKVFGKSILASFVMAGFLYFLNEINLFLLIMIAVFSYFSILYLIKGFSKELVKEIIKIRV
ncbi:MAG: hypothetical protein COY82_00050 [Parcubacteria group bacterium CG_4_10_14_0_8_um_filter_35_7]|nr:MAG: hypothetical protein COY82_00050 [Parcubacteria group bacterium CG_4_10_14_0_8_um_filter_35_7]